MGVTLGSSTSTTDGHPPPSQHDSTFWRQSAHHQAERIQNSRWGLPVSPQSIAASSPLSRSPSHGSSATHALPLLLCQATPAICGASESLSG
jgi:hypothetical protein